ncbi:hypothetical protein D018_0810 [Vibrio parahaemolyticus VP2007-007]|nr:hypothetical protein D018_0810 [Vibrio parahaemolyticus VP2007-007]
MPASKLAFLINKFCKNHTHQTSHILYPAVRFLYKKLTN